LVAPVADWEKKRRWVDYAFTRMNAPGYTISSSTLPLNPAKPNLLFANRVWAWAESAVKTLGVALV